MLNRQAKFFILLGMTMGLAMTLLPNISSAAEVRGLRMWPAPDNTRLVFDLNDPVEHSLFALTNPNRIVIDLKNTKIGGALPSVAYNESRIKGIRYAKRGETGLRVVLDLKNAVQPKSFVLKPHGAYGNRLVVDLFDAEQSNTVIVKRPDYQTSNTARDLIIAIDAGHGGEDPGAIGQRGTREKDVVLKIAKELEQLIKRERGMTPLMVRTGDYYIGLKERVKKAQIAQADLFISIHADAFKNGKARGTSVFILSERGASSDLASFLADSENSADLSGGVSSTNDDLLNMVLADMVKNSTLEDSHQVASKVLAGLKGVNHLHKSSVEQAGFAVLKAGRPAILVETAFISNRNEERKLRSRKHQRALAKAIFKGTRAYFHSNPVPGTLLALRDRKHRITRGETLTSIARQYQVSLATIRDANDLNNNKLRIGKVLSIPVI
ncbi:MAG: N-acetylmuramoyl-L-alanine amidase [Gammaproteobacteria bacterium]|nr:N-acetylmuramoyl-L-alanine amidase [Gammaproteobacteria bacterium]